jgi:hypothetical protein
MTMLSNLLSGLIGGVVGGLLSVMAAFMGIRHERSQMRLDTSRVAVGAISKNMLAIRTSLDQAQWALDPARKAPPSAVDSPMATILAATRSILYEYKGLIADMELRSRIDKLVDMVANWYDNAEESSAEVNQQGISSIDSYMGFVNRSIDAHRDGQPLPLDQAAQVG